LGLLGDEFDPCCLIGLPAASLIRRPQGRKLCISYVTAEIHQIRPLCFIVAVIHLVAAGDPSCRIAKLNAAAKAGALISIPFRPGQFVLQGETLASISPASKLASLTPLVTHGITMGRHRVLSQDLEFGVAQIVEIAIRALSPAINDTFTGVASVDLLGEALTILADAPQRSGRWFDTNGKMRLQVRPLLLPRLVKQAFDQIRQAAAENPAVLIRLLSTIGRLAPKLQGAEDRSALVEQAAAVWETANTRPLVKMDREDIEAAWQKTMTALAPLEVRETAVF
jgi:uncharacterized membrane protein